MTELVAFVLGNFTLTFLILGVLASGFSLLFHRPGCRQAVAERFLAGYLFFAIGLSFLYNFVLHVFFADMAAHFIGWANSPFQYEVGYASLGFAVIAILAHRSSFHFRLAAILGPSLFLWGAAIGHIHQIIAVHNDSPGNAGVILWTDILLPVLGFLLLHFSYRRSKA